MRPSPRGGGASPGCPHTKEIRVEYFHGSSKTKVVARCALCICCLPGFTEHLGYSARTDPPLSTRFSSRCKKSTNKPNLRRNEGRLQVDQRLSRKAGTTFLIE